MKKLFTFLTLALFVFACSGSPDQTKETSSEDAETSVVDENLKDLESAANEIIDEAEELASEVDSLIQNL